MNKQDLFIILSLFILVCGFTWFLMQGAAVDPVMSKYVASGLNQEAVSLAVVNFGDNPKKVILQYAHIII